MLGWPDGPAFRSCSEARCQGVLAICAGVILRLEHSPSDCLCFSVYFFQLLGAAVHNIFITQLMDWKPSNPAPVRLLNFILRALGTKMQLVSPYRSGSMTNTEQRMNLFHLVSQVLISGIPGDLIELGSERGQTAVLFSKVMSGHGSDRRLHLYTIFENDDALQSLHRNFANVGEPVPELHVGLVQETLPSQLPEKISFAHIDLGSKVAGDVKALILHCLKHVYPRLQKGGICVFQDYCDPSVLDSWNPWPGIKAACDEFFADKPEKVSIMYAGWYSHGYVRKL